MSGDAHGIRVAQVARMLAEAGGLKEDAPLIEACARLHDLGKIDVPSSILDKPGPLTAGEFEIVKQHARLGAERIRGMMDFLSFAVDTARFHHEHFDGQGGYEGLKGEEIPVYARVVALADVVDAMVSRRPYKEPIPLENVLEYVRENAGSQFDPYWAKVLLECGDKLNAIYLGGDVNQ